MGELPSFSIVYAGVLIEGETAGKLSLEGDEGLLVANKVTKACKQITKAIAKTFARNQVVRRQSVLFVQTILLNLSY
jgi:hypothetical protein